LERFHHGVDGRIVTAEQSASKAGAFELQRMRDLTALMEPPIFNARFRTKS
jgi:hypothetical protein